MTSYSKTVWRCDRCQMEIDLGLNEQPKQWMGVELFSPPQSAGAMSKRRHYCSPCSSLIQDSLYALDAKGEPDE